MPLDRSEIDRAYACFLFAGLVALITAALSFAPVEGGWAGGLGLLVAVPLSLLALAAIGLGVLLSLLLWRHWPLPVLSAASLLLLAEIVGEYGPVAFYNAAPVIYGLIVLAVSAAWFLFARRRFPAPPTRPSSAP